MDGKTIDDLDRESQIIIEVLLNRGGAATAGYIREQTGLEQTQQVHYRVDEWLTPLGIVDNTGEKREYEGNESKVYELTDTGEEVALQQNLDLAPELHRGQLEREIGQLIDNISLTQEHAKVANNRAVEAHERLDSVKATVDGWDGEMSSLRSDVERVDTRLTRLSDLISDDVNHEADIQDVRDEVESLRDEINEIRDEIEDINEFHRETSDWARGIEERLAELEDESREDDDDDDSGWI